MGGGGFAGDHGNGPGWDKGRNLPGGLPDPDRVVIPDDISELDAELRALHREQIRERWLSRLGADRWRKYGPSLPVIIMTVVLVALMSGLASLLTPASTGRPQPAPLARPAVTPGTVGGLLPDTTLRLYNDEVQARSRRPAVIAIPQPGCNCEETLDAIYRKTSSQKMQFDLVGPPSMATELRVLDQRIGNGGALVFIDPTETLTTTYASSLLTVLVVAADGVVLSILNDPTRTTPLRSLLARAAAEPVQ